MRPDPTTAMSRHIATALTATIVTTILLTGVASGRASAPGKQPPKNLTPPSISGVAQLGSGLTASTGTWQRVSGYAYQWLRCDAAGANCVGVSGATASTYAVASGDAGATLRILVTATNKNGSAAATSAATALVRSPSPPAAPAPSAATSPSVASPPTISGTAQQGQTLSASTGSWNGTTPVSYTYQWARCDSSGSSCALIAAATGSTYVLVSADVGSTVRVSVTASNSAGSVTASSAATTIVAPPPSYAAPVPGIDGAWYSSTSAWNTPIPASPPIAPASANYVSALINNYNGNCAGTQGCLAPTDYYSSPSIWIADNSTPLTTVWVNFPNTCHQSEAQVPIPSGAVPSHAGDPEPQMTILNKDTGDEWDLWKVTTPGVTPMSSPGGGQNCPASNAWQAVIAKKISPGWTGSGSALSARASGTLFGAGVIRPRDWQQPDGATFDHAIAWAYNNNLSGSYVYPAISTDGQCGDASKCAPMGSRWQLDPSINCSTWPSLQGTGRGYVYLRQVCRTLQKYGMIIVESGTGFYTENSISGESTNANADPPHNGQAAPWSVSPYIQFLPKDLYPYLRVIDWARWTH